MRMALGSGKHHHAVRVSIFLIAAALAVGIAACDGPDTYQLAISSTAGGSVSVPGEGAVAYGVGTVVQLVATPDSGYEFHLWTGDIRHIANPNSASTTIIMNGNYSVIASFDREGEVGPIEP